MDSWEVVGTNCFLHEPGAVLDVLGRLRLHIKNPCAPLCVTAWLFLWQELGMGWGAACLGHRIGSGSGFGAGRGWLNW